MNEKPLPHNVYRIGDCIAEFFENHSKRPKRKPKHKSNRRRVDAKQKTFNQETKKMTTKKEAQIDVNAEAFEKSLAGFEPAYYGEFTQDERETMRRFFDLNAEAQRLGVQADGIKAEIETFENQIQGARGKYAALIAEGHTAKAMAAVEQIPSMRSRQEALKKQLPGIAARLDELEKAVAGVDHSRFLNEAKEAATAAEQARCRATSIFGRPGDVRRSINESREKLK